MPFDRGAEKIYFNPNDFELYNRITEAVNQLGEIYDGQDKKIEAAATVEEKLKVLADIDAAVKMKLDWAFGNNVSDTIFKYVSPHGIVKGNQYFAFYVLEYILNQAGKIAKETSEAARKELEKAMNKHAKKYVKK